MNKLFCNYGEFLLFVDAAHGGYIHECDMEQTRTVYEAAKEAAETVKQIIRMDKCNLSNEDVTEEVAMAWLTSDMINPDDARSFPLYVQNSEALDTYTQAYREEKATFLAMQAQGVA